MSKLKGITFLKTKQSVLSLTIHFRVKPKEFIKTLFMNLILVAKETILKRKPFKKETKGISNLIQSC